MQECILCQSNNVKELPTKRILKKYDVKYYQCAECGLHFTEKPYWLEEAYSEALSCLDTGAVTRNMSDVISISLLLKNFYGKEDKILDYGGGYGVFVRMMRDKGFDFRWYDKYAEPLLCKGFEWKKEKVSLITSFECFEHMSTPREDIDYLFSISNNIIFSTITYSDSLILPEDDWSYYYLLHGQHVSLYSRITLEYIAKKYNVNYYKIFGLHWFTDKKVSQRKINFLNKLYRRLMKLYKIDYYYCAKDCEKLTAEMNGDS